MKRWTLVLTALVVAGCSGIPNSGPVVQGDRIDIIRNDGYVRVIARPPSDGMKPEALVRGYLAASASVADGDDTARMYLTTSSAAAWKPAARTEVYDAAGLTVTSEGNDTVRISAPLLGTIDAGRHYTVAEPGAVVTEELRLQQVDGQWRISSVPNALYLEEGDVARSFRAHPVYFLDLSQQRLVPEYVLLPVGAGNVATALTRAIIDGPVSSRLSTMAPKGTQLLYGSAISDFGWATVGLNRRVTALNMADRTVLLAQITWTLTDLPNVNNVYVQVDGEQLTSVAGAGAHSRADFPEYDPGHETQSHPLLYVRDNDVYSVLAGTRRRVRSGDPTAEAALSADDRTMVAVAASRKLLYIAVGDARPMFVASGSDLAAPTVLSTGEAWFVDREARGGLLTWDVKNGVLPVDTGLPARTRILDFAIAPDESRIAVIVNDGATTTVRLGMIVRGADGVQVHDLKRVEQRLTSAVAVAWATEDQLAVIGAVGAVAVQPLGITLPLGTITLFGGPANAVSLAAVPGAAMVVADQAGQLWQYLDSRWSASELGRAPNYAR